MLLRVVVEALRPLRSAFEVRSLTTHPNGRVAQLAEHSTLNRLVVGSIPTASTNKFAYETRYRRGFCFAQRLVAIFCASFVLCTFALGVADARHRSHNLRSPFRRLQVRRR